IVAAIEPTDVGDLSQIGRMDQRQLNVLAEGMARALLRAREAPGKIGLVDADMRKRLADDVAFGSTSVGRDMIRGFEQGLAQTRP
ncbi:hypothetical protein, partial [Acinetobacter baumannii]|uniref:hypothetical protein n=1 Tax=Acinetobacter baumannii TaxID=470 RepID=UPI0013D23528